jgi:hypothetical protein
MVAEMEQASEPEPGTEPGGEVFVEPRWPIALVLFLFIIVTVVLRVAEPHREALGPGWLVPGLEIALLAALIRRRSPVGSAWSPFTRCG